MGQATHQITAPKVSVDLTDFLRLMEAAAFGHQKAKGLKADFTVRAWGETLDKLNKTAIDDGRTKAERDQSAHDRFAADCAQYGAD